MRIHHLSISAFGPFAGTEEIDFDRLSAHGLFLLNGPTGAGKTSVLDAICFALYGSVPGARQDGKRLRSDHADPAQEPAVSCEFTAQGRRFEVTRWPAWNKPSARGKNGFTTQQAKTLLRERVDGSWQEKSARNDEAGAEILAVLGMSREQFTRVVMLPQGDFAAFLRSKASDRLDLLQQLFGTQRFEAVEKELARQAAAARDEVAALFSQLAMLSARAESEVADLELVYDDVPAEETPERLAWLSTAVAGQVQALASVAVAARADATNRADAVAAEEARQHRSAILVSATAREEAVQQAAPGMAEQTARLERHRQAEVLAAQLQAVDTSLARADAAESAAESALTLLRMAAAEDVELAQLDLTERDLTEGVPTEHAQAGNGLDPTGTVFAGRVAATELGRLRSLLAVVEDRLPDEDRLRDLRRQHSAAVDQHTALTASLQELTAREGRLATERSDLRSGLPDLEALAGELALRTKAATDAQDLVLIVRKYSTAVQSRDTVQARFEQAREVRLDTKQRWLDLREARLLNAAAELAAQLAAGGECPVCGSTDHPALAVSAASGPGLAQAEEVAAAEHDGAEAVFAQVAALLNDADQQVAVLAGQGGATPEAEAVAAAAGCREAAADAQDASERLAVVRDRLQDLELVLESSVQQRTSLESELSQATVAMASFAEQADVLDAALLELRNGHRSLPQRLRGLENAVDVLAKAINAQEQRDRARSAAAEAREQLAGALPGAGFDSAEEARNQLLDPAQVLQLQASIRTTLDEAARVSELFASPDLVLAKQEAATGGNIDAQGLLALRDASAEADARARDTELSAGMARRCLASVQTIRAEYAQLAGSAEGPAENARMLAGLADAAAGRGDNTYRMSLNSYVLAARLEQVAAAASERLVAMSDGRYLLQYTDAKAAKGAKSGLGLEVVDQWTGFRRDTSTLSGGESFMASLSLALGLADVVQQESGGVEIETLFVDEGFGSLDEQSLEQVMDALEGLRDGGRVVGLVSHVAEMKQRIGVQLQVIKARNGSSLRISDAVELTD